jgi:predicted aconitase
MNKHTNVEESSPVELTPEEQAMLRGEKGEAVRQAIRLQLEIAKFWGAKRMVPVTNVHIMGDMEVLGDAGKNFLCEVAASKAHAICPATTNPRCVDFAFADRLGQNPETVGKELHIVSLFKSMNITPVNTCINYQTVYQPHLGEHVAWGDTGTVIYANSVFGARTNFESGPAALAAALTGRTAAYGFHLDENRRGTFLVELNFTPTDFADWGAIGKIVGERNQNYLAVPVFVGANSPSSDNLKHLGAALAAYGSMAMFHMVGVTPEARSVEDAFGGRQPSHVMSISQKEIDAVYAGYRDNGNPLDLVVFSGPQLSIFELTTLANLFRGKRVNSGTQVIATTTSGIKKHIQQTGVLQILEEAGVLILEGVCFYILQNLSQMREQNGWINVITNSAKLANNVGAHKLNGILRRTADCVEIATGTGA